MTVVTIALVSASLLLALAAGLWGWRGRAPEAWQFLAAAVVEVLVIAFVVVAVVRLATGDHPHQKAVYIGYLIGTVLVMPVAAALALSERSRYGTLVVALGAVVVPVLVARVYQVHG